MNGQRFPSATFDRRLLWEVPWRAIRNFFSDDCVMLAAAIAFYSLLSLAPTLYLIGLTLEVFTEDVDVSQHVIDVIAQFLPPEALPTVERVNRELDFRGSFAFVAIPGLMWIATQAVRAFQLALNVAFDRTTKGRALVSSRFKSLMVLVVGAGFLGALLLLDTVLALLIRFSAVLGIPLDALIRTGWLSALAIPGVTLLVFYLFYRLLPTGRCERLPAAVGALVAMLLWSGSRQLLGRVVGQSPTFGIVTGTLASALAFMLLTHIGAMLVLFGAEIAAVLNGDRST